MFKELFESFADLIDRSCPGLDHEAFLLKTEQLYFKHKAVNDIHNLTRITSPADFFEKHIVDSLMIGLVFPEIMNSPFHIADIGCGGGFPCLPLAMVNPSLTIRGIESLGKKVTAVNEIAMHCGFENLEVSKFRAREASREKQFNRQFDIVTARAVATVDTLIKECRQLLKPGGKMLFYKTPEAIKKEHALAERDCKKHKLTLELSEIFTLSEESGDRQFFIIQS
jgi:16S rRNA (guanine527-N7)-methyltransferase